MAGFKLCSVLDCGKRVHAHTFCHMHYSRWRRNGDPIRPAPPPPTYTCSVHNCGKPHKARGLCESHYTRMRNHGDPLGGRSMAAVGEPLRYFRDVVLPHGGDECLHWPFARDGHGYAVMHGDTGRMVSRRVCEAVNGPPPTPKHQAAHSCGNGHLGCVSPLHLSWKTRQQNEADKIVHKTQARGERHGQAKLTEQDVLSIRALKGKMLQKDIAKAFNVSRSRISYIHNRVEWGWLD